MFYDSIRWEFITIAFQLKINFVYAINKLERGVCEIILHSCLWVWMCACGVGYARYMLATIWPPNRLETYRFQNRNRKQNPHGSELESWIEEWIEKPTQRRVYFIFIFIYKVFGLASRHISQIRILVSASMAKIYLFSCAFILLFCLHVGSEQAK